MRRQVAVFSIEIVTIISAASLAFLLRFDFSIPASFVHPLLLASGIWVGMKLAAFKLFGLDRRWARYISLSDLLRLTLSNLVGSIASAFVLLLLSAGVPRTIYAIDLLLCVTITAGLRIGVRLLAESGRNRPSHSNRKRTLIYGAGNAGAILLRDLRQNPAITYDVCGFIDDDPRKSGLVLHGAKVLGGGDSLSAIAIRTGAEVLLIAIPSASGSEMNQILHRCTSAGIVYKTIPGLAELIQEDGLARQIRDVAVEDLLGRVPVDLELDRISAQLQGNVVLVTGAAGSIGSELCRQIARFRPEAIVGYEIAESPLFCLGAEIARSFPGIRFHAEIGSIQNPARLREVFDLHRPSVVYHAAAYKHVPLMESHIVEAIQNNVFGTLNVLQAARACYVTQFVMISSDKAVRPANVMGATKRVAELLVRSLQPHDSRYVSVRFGNVLGSSGSVVPVFKDQIAHGGPVTVTDPEMRRFFMTIPEACQLVLQASTMGRGGEIFVLDMGQPVRIVDLARNLILLSGLRPDIDIPIEFTGVRPGEKLMEELNEDEEGLVATSHLKIRIFAGASKPRTEMQCYLDRLRHCCDTRNARESLSLLHEIVPHFNRHQSRERAGAAAR